jgi:hypothetical protein
MGGLYLEAVRMKEQRTPQFTATRVVKLPARDSGVHLSILRVHPSRIDSRRMDPMRFVRRQPVLLQNCATGATTICFVMGAGDVHIPDRQGIAIDYDARDALDLNRGTDNDTVEVLVRPATGMEILRFYARHPDLGYQLPTRLALIGLFLGVAGLVLEVVMTMLEVFVF